MSPACRVVAHERPRAVRAPRFCRFKFIVRLRAFVFRVGAVGDGAPDRCAPSLVSRADLCARLRFQTEIAARSVPEARGPPTARSGHALHKSITLPDHDSFVLRQRGLGEADSIGVGRCAARLFAD